MKINLLLISIPSFLPSQVIVMHTWLSTNHICMIWFAYKILNFRTNHYSDVIVGTIACQVTSLTIVYSTVYSGADERKYQSSAALAFGRWIHRWLVNSPHKWPVTRKMFPFDDVIMSWQGLYCNSHTEPYVAMAYLIYSISRNNSNKNQWINEKWK